MKKKLTYGLLTLLLLNPIISWSADAPLTIATSVKANTLAFRVGEKVINQVSQLIKVPLKLIHLPADRASHLFSLGSIDAEFSRVSAYQKIRPTAIKGQEPISKFPLYVFSTDKMFSVEGWHSLKPYRILTVKGWIFTRDTLANFNTVEVESPFQALRMLKAGRGDVFVADLFSANSILNEVEFDRGDIKRLEKPIAVLDTYTFFLAKHADIAKAYSGALATLKREGLYQKILRETR